MTCRSRVARLEAAAGARSDAARCGTRPPTARPHGGGLGQAGLADVNGLRNYARPIEDKLAAAPPATNRLLQVPHITLIGRAALRAVSRPAQNVQTHLLGPDPQERACQ